MGCWVARSTWAAARAAGPVIAAAVELVAGDAHRLPFGPSSFDVVHAHQVLQHLDDPVTTLREMARVARPGAPVVVRDADYAAMTWYPPEPRLDRWLASYRAYARANGGEPDAGRHLRAWARAAGLTDTTLTATTSCYATQEATGWWGGAWADRVESSAFASQTLDRGLETAQSLADLADGWRSWATHPDAVFVVPHVELLARV